MARHLVYGGAMRPVVGRSVSSLACLLYVALLGLAFWAGVLWLGQTIFQSGAFGF